jgi:hypothetical protein
MATRDNERDIPAQQKKPMSDDEMIRGRAEGEDMTDESDDEFEDTEDLDDEHGDKEGTF